MKILYKTNFITGLFNNKKMIFRSLKQHLQIIFACEYFNFKLFINFTIISYYIGLIRTCQMWIDEIPRSDWIGQYKSNCGRAGQRFCELGSIEKPPRFAKEETWKKICWFLIETCPMKTRNKRFFSPRIYITRTFEWQVTTVKRSFQV